MKLLPFLLTQKRTSEFTIHKLSLFLSHAGKSLWHTDESGMLSPEVLQEEYLVPNGMQAKSIRMDPKLQIAYIEVEKDTLQLNDFYTWEEAMAKPSKPECWRNFYFVTDKQGADWWSPKGLLEAELPEVGNIGLLFSKLQDT